MSLLDTTYHESAPFRRKERTLQPPFKELGEWFFRQFGIEVLTILYQRIVPLKRSRLNIVLNTIEEEQRFRAEKGFGYDPAAAEGARDEFVKIVTNQGNFEFELDGLFVVFSSLERLARDEAVSKITGADLDQLKARLNNEDLWDIVFCAEIVIFCFFTEEQRSKYVSPGPADLLVEEYLALLKSHDEFGYFTRDNVPVAFFSKEELDTKYHGNWLFYFK